MPTHCILRLDNWGPKVALSSRYKPTDSEATVDKVRSILFRRESEHNKWSTPGPGILHNGASQSPSAPPSHCTAEQS